MNADGARGDMVRAVDLTETRLKNGEWYAFDLEGRKFFATVYLNGSTGFLELTEIDNPWISAPASGGDEQAAAG